MKRFKNLFADEALTYEQFCERMKENDSIRLYGEEEMNSVNALLDAEKAAREADAREFSIQLDETRRDLMIDMALQKAGARNIRAARALIDDKLIKLENGALAGAEEQIVSARESCPYLFGKTGNPPPPKGGKGAAVGGADEKEKWREEAGLPTRR